MKATLTITTPNETFDVHFEIEDETTAQAKLAHTLQEIQKRFCNRTDAKKTASRTPRDTAAPGPATPTK